MKDDSAIADDYDDGRAIARGREQSPSPPHGAIQKKQDSPDHNVRVLSIDRNSENPRAVRYGDGRGRGGGPSWPRAEMDAGDNPRRRQRQAATGNGPHNWLRRRGPQGPAAITRSPGPAARSPRPSDVPPPSVMRLRLLITWTAGVRHCWSLRLIFLELLRCASSHGSHGELG